MKTEESVELELISSPALHPHLIITPPSPSRDGCQYHISLSFHDAVFIDRDEVSGLWDSDHVSWSLSPGKIDIERPVRDGAEAVRLDLQLAPHVKSLDLPLHVRYLQPNQHGSEDIKILQDGTINAGWACGNSPLILAPIHTSKWLSLPTGRTEHQPIVLLVTPLVIWLGWAYLFRKIMGIRCKPSASETDIKYKTS